MPGRLGHRQRQGPGHSDARHGLGLSRLVDADPQLVRYMVQAHEWLGFLLYALLAAHIGAALWHHWVVKDGTLGHGPSGLAPGAARTALAERVLSDAPAQAHAVCANPEFGYSLPP